jgi:hypothetical protein
MPGLRANVTGRAGCNETMSAGALDARLVLY